MSDTMFYGVLRMPYKLAMGSEMTRLQYWQRAQEAADRVESAEAELKRAKETIATYEQRIVGVGAIALDSVPRTTYDTALKELQESREEADRLRVACEAVFGWCSEPPIRDQVERGRMISVRAHALAYLYEAVHGKPAKPIVASKWDYSGLDNLTPK